MTVTFGLRGVVGHGVVTSSCSRTATEGVRQAGGVLPVVPPSVTTALLVVGVLLMATGAGLVVLRVRRTAAWVPARGEVTGYRQTNGQSFPVVRFTTREGQVVTATQSTTVDVGVYPTGGPVAVRYDPERPERFVRDGGLRIGLLGPVLDVLGVLLVAAGVLLA